MNWQVDFHPDCEAWADTLDLEDSDALFSAIKVLRDLGPSLGRPLVDSVTQTKLSNQRAEAGIYRPQGNQGLVCIRP